MPVNDQESLLGSWFPKQRALGLHDGPQAPRSPSRTLARQGPSLRTDGETEAPTALSGLGRGSPGSRRRRREPRSESPTPRPLAQGGCHPRQKETPTCPLEAPDLAEHTACPAAPFLRQIYSALIWKMQLSLSFIAEIKQTRKGKKKKKASMVDSPETELAVTKLAEGERPPVSSLGEEGPPPICPYERLPKDGVLAASGWALEGFPIRPWPGPPSHSRITHPARLPLPKGGGSVS